jgi:hypothetical protein
MIGFGRGARGRLMADGKEHAPAEKRWPLPGWDGTVNCKPDQKNNFGGARYGWKMMRGKLVDLLARIP